MKIAVRCLSCGQVTRLYGSYAVKLTERTTSVLTGEIKEQELMGRVCPDCAAKAGYKTRKTKPDLVVDSTQG